MKQMRMIGFLALWPNGARWYDPALGRFIQADTIVPQPGNPLAWDRYAYGFNNPLYFIDPSGHKACSGDGDSLSTCQDPFSVTLDELAATFGITFTGQWTDRNKIIVIFAVSDAGSKFAEQLGGSASDAFRKVYKQGVNFTWGTSGAQSYCFTNGVFGSGGCTNSGTSINFVSLIKSTVHMPGGTRSPADAFKSAVNNVIHELGHAFASLWYRKGGSEYGTDGPYVNIPSTLLHDEGFVFLPDPNKKTWRQHPGDTGEHEIFADMFLGWTYGIWDYRTRWGDARNDFMNMNMVEWISTRAK